MSELVKVTFRFNGKRQPVDVSIGDGDNLVVTVNGKVILDYVQDGFQHEGEGN